VREVGRSSSVSVNFSPRDRWVRPGGREGRGREKMLKAGKVSFKREGGKSGRKNRRFSLTWRSVSEGGRSGIWSVGKGKFAPRESVVRLGGNSVISGLDEHTGRFKIVRVCGKRSRECEK
jgi:hypothetical protein